MSNKLHFAIVPDSLIAKRRPEELQIYCELYMLEVSNQRYTLKLICADRDWKYTTAYRLLRLARETLGTSRQKSRASNQKRKRNENKKNNLDTPRPIDTRVSNAKTEQKETQTDGNTQQTNTNNKKGRPDSPQSIDVVAPLQSESRSITNDLTSESGEIRIGSVQGCAPIPEPTSSLLTYESFCKLSVNAQSNYIANMGERWADK